MHCPVLQPPEPFQPYRRESQQLIYAENNYALYSHYFKMVAFGPIFFVFVWKSNSEATTWAALTICILYPIANPHSMRGESTNLFNFFQMKLPPIPELLKLYNIKPKRNLSQNFLKAPRAFCEVIRPDENALVVEIGCGPGSITRQLLKKCPRVIGIEVDDRFDPILAQLRDCYSDKFNYILADALSDRNFQLTNRITNLYQDSPPHSILIVGNLPFAIAGRLISQCNYQSLLNKGFFTKPTTMLFMVAKAVGDRLLPTHPKRTQFGAITNTAFDVTLHRVFPKADFVPSPQDDALALKFKHRGARLFANDDQVDNYIKFMAAVYKLPNKQASGAFSRIPNGQEILFNSNVDPKTRMYDIPLDKFVEMSKQFKS